ncbi:unnamed protein product, partial [Larinioides sclopetarius]
IRKSSNYLLKLIGIQLSFLSQLVSKCLHSARKYFHFDSELDSIIQNSINATFINSSTMNAVATTDEAETMTSERNTNAEGGITRLAVNGIIDGRVDDSDIITRLNKFLEQGGTSQLRSITNEGVHDPASRSQLVDICKLLTSYYDQCRSAISEDKLQGEIYKVSETSSKYKNNLELRNDFSNWCKARKELIEISKSTANRLDQQFFIINIARMIGSIVDALNSLDLGLCQQMCFSVGCYVDNFSPNLGIIIKSALQFAPHLRYMGFVSSFIDILESQVAIKRVMNVVKNDEDMFEPIEEWLKETEKFNDNVKRLLPYQINNEITKSIEDALGELGEEQKIFSAAILSNIMKDPMIHKDKKFMTDAVRFCRSDAAKGWYERIIKGACPSELDRDLMSLHEELQKLEGADADVASTVENGKCMAQTVEIATKTNERSDFGRVAIFTMSGMSIYWSIGNIRAGSKHRYSDRLRKLSRKAQSFLNVMEQINF